MKDWKWWLCFSVLYPFIHISTKNTVYPTKPGTITSNSNDSLEWMEQCVITELDQISSSKQDLTIPEIEYVIFIGLRIDNDDVPSRIGNEW